MFSIAAETAPGRELAGPPIEIVADSGPVANGPQSGNALRPPMPVRLTWPVPLAAAVQTLKLWPPASREKAIRVPSGDQLGSVSRIEAPVRLAAPEPLDAFIVHDRPLRAAVAEEGDLRAGRRPVGIGVDPITVRQPRRRSGAVRVRSVDLGVACARGHEGDLGPVGRPRDTGVLGGVVGDVDLPVPSAFMTKMSAFPGTVLV